MLFSRLIYCKYMLNASPSSASVEGEKVERYPLVPGVSLGKNIYGLLKVYSDDGRSADILRANKDPYCGGAEGVFVESLENDLVVRHSSVPITLYIRDDQSMSVGSVVFTADIVVKRLGTPSAMIVAPSELKGFICAPDIHNRGMWIVVRPFNKMNSYPRHDLVGDFGYDVWYKEMAQASLTCDLASLDSFVLSSYDAGKLLRKCTVLDDGHFLRLSGSLNRYAVPECFSMTDVFDRDYFVCCDSAVRWPVFVESAGFCDTATSYKEFVRGNFVNENGSLVFVTRALFNSPAYIDPMVYSLRQGGFKGGILK